MNSLWNDTEAATFTGELGPRVYSSRLLGRDKSLVLHGGGNTSVKLTQKNIFGESEEILHVKGSGWDLELIEPAGFTPVRLDYVRRLGQLPTLSDPKMVAELAGQTIRPGAPAPSVETILHALLPHAYVDHTHADAVLSVTNAPQGEQRIRDIYGDRVVIIPYVMPGFDLAALCAREYPKQVHAGTLGMVLLNHGIFSFGQTARESYERMIMLVDLAEQYLQSKKSWQIHMPTAHTPNIQRQEIAALRQAISAAAGHPMLCQVHATPEFLSVAQQEKFQEISQRGPVTPDHIIRTKQTPMLGRDVDAYSKNYRAYFERNAAKAREPKTMLDTAPRMVLDPAFGLMTVGRSARDTQIVADLYTHSVEVFLRAEALGGWNALPERDLFEVEYWDLEQAKLRKAGTPAVFQGEVVLITGAASGIGQACVERFLARGAAVVALDKNPSVTKLYQRPDYLGAALDLTDPVLLDQALTAAVKQFGGIDMLVLNAGIFPASTALENLTNESWRHTLNINLDAPLTLMQACHELLKCAPRGGRIAIIGSKNVPAPGPGAAAYSASKAALNQVARVAALEWGKDNIRINSLHPNAVYDTAIWTPEVLESRAKAYGLSVQAYRTNNVLRTEVAARDVAELAAELCGPLFAKTTGAQIPVDGGNERVI